MLFSLFIAALFTCDVLSEISSNSIKQTPVAVCSDGTFMNEDNKCINCTKCTSTLTPCNSTHDAICECQPGYYRDSLDKTCKECTKCSVGWGASPACTPTSNTACIACPPGSYSNIVSSTRSCQSCTQCGKNEFSLQKCTSKSDTTCFRYEPKRNTEVPQSNIKCTAGDCAPKDTSYLYTAPLYCALLGFIIFGLLIYVILRCRNNKKRAIQAGICQKQTLTQYQIIQQTPYNYCQTSSVVYLQSDGKIVTATTRYKDVPSTIRKTIQRSLSKDGSWLKLANCLGFTPSEVSQIQQRAEQNSKGLSPVSILLTEWVKRDYSTVGVMAHALLSIERLDLVKLLQINTNGTEVV